MTRLANPFSARRFGAAAPWLDLVNSELLDGFGHATECLDDPQWRRAFAEHWKLRASFDAPAAQKGLRALRALLRRLVEKNAARGSLSPFQINTDGSEFAVLKYFSGSDGACPNAGLVLSGTTLYGVTVNGGGLNSGVLFSLSLLPAILAPPQSQTTGLGTAINMTVNAGNNPMLTYRWFFNGTNLISCSTNCELELTNVQYFQSGSYTVVVTNLFGAVTSAPFMLNVIAPMASADRFRASK